MLHMRTQLGGAALGYGGGGPVAFPISPPLYFFFFFLRSGHGLGGGFSRWRGRSPRASGDTWRRPRVAARPIPELSALFLPLRARRRRTPTPPPGSPAPAPASQIPSCHPAAPGSAPPAAFAPPSGTRARAKLSPPRGPCPLPPCSAPPLPLCILPGDALAAAAAGLGTLPWVILGLQPQKCRKNTQSRVPRVLCPRSVPSAPTSACSQLCTARSSLPKPTPGRSLRDAAAGEKPTPELSTQKTGKKKKKTVNLHMQSKSGKSTAPSSSHLGKLHRGCLALAKPPSVIPESANTARGSQCHA